MKTIKLVFIISFITLVFTSCSSGRLYYWGGEYGNSTRYEKSAYNYYKQQSPESICTLIETYQDIMINCKENEKMIPPGICAEFGYILLNPDNEAYFNEKATKSQKQLMEGIVFSEYGKELLEKEMSLYPESRHLLEPIVKRINNQ